MLTQSARAIRLIQLEFFGRIGAMMFLRLEASPDLVAIDEFDFRSFANMLFELESENIEFPPVVLALICSGFGELINSADIEFCG